MNSRACGRAAITPPRPSIMLTEERKEETTRQSSGRFRTWFFINLVALSRQSASKNASYRGSQRYYLSKSIVDQHVKEWMKCYYRCILIYVCSPFFSFSSWSKNFWYFLRRRLSRSPLLCRASVRRRFNTGSSAQSPPTKSKFNTAVS
jgi:hypothetical protein